MSQVEVRITNVEEKKPVSAIEALISATHPDVRDKITPSGYKRMVESVITAEWEQINKEAAEPTTEFTAANAIKKRATGNLDFWIALLKPLEGPPKLTLSLEGMPNVQNEMFIDLLQLRAYVTGLETAAKNPSY